MYWYLGRFNEGQSKFTYNVSLIIIIFLSAVHCSLSRSYHATITFSFTFFRVYQLNWYDLNTILKIAYCHKNKIKEHLGS